MKAISRVAAALMTALAVASVAGCGGSMVFPTGATLPATLDQAYDELQARGADAEPSEPTRVFLTAFDPAAARPSVPVRPTEPRPSALAAERFALANLQMSDRPAAGTACSTIAAGVGGEQARCAEKGDAALSDALPAGVPTGSYLVGKAYADGRMVLLDQPGEGEAMWDAAMHERGHLLAAWLCGRADCLNPRLVARGYRDSAAYLGSLTEGFAQSWAQCHGAARRTDYVVIPCGDVQSIVDVATAEKTTAKKDYDAAKATYDEALARFQQGMRDYDERLRRIDALTKAADRIKSQA